MADLGPGILAVVSTSIGGLIAAGAGFAQARTQARSQERMEQHRFAKEMEKAAVERAAAADAETDARERAALIALGEAVQRTDEGMRRVERGDFSQIQRLAYQVNDPVLHGFTEGGWQSLNLLKRAGYLLRTPQHERTDDGHETIPLPDH